MSKRTFSECLFVAPRRAPPPLLAACVLCHALYRPRDVGCALCDDGCCLQHAATCAFCDRATCGGCRDRCPVPGCNAWPCVRCQRECADCGQRACRGCVPAPACGDAVCDECAAERINALQ